MRQSGRQVRLVEYSSKSFLPCRRCPPALLRRLIDHFLPAGPIVLGIGDTIERRRGKRIGLGATDGAPSNRTGVRATGLIIEDGAVTGVQTDSGVVGHR